MKSNLKRLYKAKETTIKMKSQSTQHICKRLTSKIYKIMRQLCSKDEMIFKMDKRPSRDFLKQNICMHSRHMKHVQHL